MLVLPAPAGPICPGCPVPGSQPARAPLTTAGSRGATRLELQLVPGRLFRRDLAPRRPGTNTKGAPGAFRPGRGWLFAGFRRGPRTVRYVNPQHPIKQLLTLHPLLGRTLLGGESPGTPGEDHAAPDAGLWRRHRATEHLPSSGGRARPRAFSHHPRPAAHRLQAPFPRRSSARRLPPLPHLPGEGSDGAAERPRGSLPGAEAWR